METKQDIVRIPVNQIYPDPDQPRKRLPQDLALARRKGMDPLALLTEVRRRTETQPGLAAFLKGLDDLATSIQQVGQLAPIRVYPDDGTRFVIEMGERRWLAHCILYFERGEPTFSHIDAIVGPKRAISIVERQALQRRMAENVHRAEFSPIEMARGLGDRIAEILAQNPELKRNQVEDLVGKENGITGRRVRQYLSLLSLCDEAQTLAQEGGLTERALRGVLKFRAPDAQVQAIRKLIAGEQQKTKSSPALSSAMIAPAKWAETFLLSVLAIGRTKKQINAYQRALRSRLKRNPRARALLNRMLHSNEHANGNDKRAMTTLPSVNAARRTRSVTGQRERDYDPPSRPDQRARRHGLHRPR